MHQRFIRTALAVAIANAFTAHAAAPVADEAAVIVTATRFAEADPRIPANVTVITAEEIRSTPALSLPDVLKTRAGINVSSLYGNLGIDASVDLRGFGDTATSNTLILVDGERFNPVDMSSISWSAIPLDDIRRIEIIRGAGTVLYGDRASGGVINIITNKSGAPHASVAATAGSYGAYGIDASGAGGGEAGYANLFAHYANSGGWRNNSHQEQQSVSGRAGLYLESGEAFVNYSVYRDANGLPGGIPTATFQSDPRQSLTPNDNQRRDGYRVRPGIKVELGRTLDLEAELGSESEYLDWNTPSYGSTSKRDRKTLSFTPRLRWRHGLGDLASETVMGVDYYDGKVNSYASNFAFQSASQKSSAFYFQNTTSLTQAWAATLGGRTQRMEQAAHQDAYPAFFMPVMDGSMTRTRNAYDLGLTYSGQGWRAYGKTASIFRFANTDELFGYDIFGNPLFAGNLRPQHGTVNELGGSVDAGSVKLRGSIYRMELTDEIGYDPNAFANVNFDPTRRQGLEAEADWRVGPSLKARLAYTHTEAEFRSGPYAGSRVPLVPREKASAQLTWEAGEAASYSAVANAVGKSPYSGDFANAFGKLPGYATLDFQGDWNAKPWKISARLLNALDKRYASWGTYKTQAPLWFTGPAGPDHWYYPADGRSLYVTARYDFR